MGLRGWMWMLGVLVACDPGPREVLDVEVEAARNARQAGLGVVEPAVLADPDAVSRCRRRTVGKVTEFRFDGPIDEAALARKLGHARISARRWAEDSRLIRVEIECDPKRLVLKFNPSWFSAQRKEVWHASSPGMLSVVPILRKRRRPKLHQEAILGELRAAAGRWRPQIVLDGRPSPRL